MDRWQAVNRELNNEEHPPHRSHLQLSCPSRLLSKFMHSLSLRGTELAFILHSPRAKFGAGFRNSLYLY